MYHLQERKINLYNNIPEYQEFTGRTNMAHILFHLTKWTLYIKVYFKCNKIL